jgi:putative membrane protein
MRQQLIRAAFGLSTILLVCSPAVAAQAPSTEEFTKNVAVSDMFEVQSGQLASEKAQNGDVKSFGEQMVADHTKTTDELKALIKDKGIEVELPGDLDEQHQTKLDELNGLSQTQFDKEYVRMQIDAHQKAVDLFGSYAVGGEIADLKEWAQDTLPTLKEHLEHAQKLKTSVDQEAKAGDNDDAVDSKKSDGTAARDETTTRADSDDAKRPAQKSDIKYLTRQTPTDWTAEALIGRTVENARGDNLGEVNNVIINEKGDVVAVVIGVGGFLGIGEKNVGVPFDALDFRTVDPAEKRADETREEKGEQKTDSTAARFDSEHENIHIVLNTTKDDLEAAPAFAWLGEENPGDARD